jgi:putative holliday junction resolvase
LSRVLALDYGSARCGAALSDPTGTLATPIEPVERPGSDAGLARIAELVREREVETVVVGLPLTLAGGESGQTAEARAFAERLAEIVAPVPVRLYDERLTTAQARRAGGSASEDSRAAAHLLEAWLDAADSEAR